MRTNSRTRVAVWFFGVAAVSAWTPEWVNAQQTGLFPLAPIRRQRTPVSEEDPVYKLYRHKYFGYHPTCWRKFPEGWGCPSPEVPDRQKSFRETPLGQRDDLEQQSRPSQEGREGGRRQPEVTRPAIPAVPATEPSPFETQPGERGRETNPPLQDNQDPFDLPQEKNRDSAPATRPATPPLAPGGNAGPQGSHQPAGDDEQLAQADEEGPILAVPTITTPPVNDGSVFDPGATRVPVAETATTNQPPRRRGILSGLFNSLSGIIRR